MTQHDTKWHKNMSYYVNVQKYKRNILSFKIDGVK